MRNNRERATSAYSRLYNLLLRISEFQPIAPPATLELLAQTIDQRNSQIRVVTARDGTNREKNAIGDKLCLKPNKP